MARIMHAQILALSLLGISPLEAQEPSNEDLVVVDVASSLTERIRDAPSGSRLVLYLVEEGRGPAGAPAEAITPFPRQPLASWDLNGPNVTVNLEAGELRAGPPQHTYPVAPSALSGSFRGQVALTFPTSGPGVPAPGNLLGNEKILELDAQEREVLRLSLNRVHAEPRQIDRSNVTLIERPSELIPRVDGRTATQRAWVVLPRQYHDLTAKRRYWPTIFVVPDLEDPIRLTEWIADLLARRDAAKFMPDAVWVILDPFGPNGHHYFIDSPLNGARRRALVEELIPWLEIRFRLLKDPGSRLLVGEGAGGRAVLGLITAHPEVFARAWALSPDAVTFQRLGAVDLYGTPNAYMTADGMEFPAVRAPLGPERDLVYASVRDEVLATHTIAPDGRSGTSWDSWRSTFGRPTPEAAFPPWPFDLETGVLDPVLVEHWSRHDLLRNAIANPGIADILRDRTRIVVGGRDEWYREQGVAALARGLGEELDAGAPEWIRIKPDATSEEISTLDRVRAYEEIIEHLLELEELEDLKDAEDAE